LPPDERIIEDDIEIFYLWDTHSDFYEVFKYLRNFLDEYNTINVPLMLKLIEARSLPLEESLEAIAIIHYGYVSTITPVQENTDG
jgi:hypothetical protein